MELRIRISIKSDRVENFLKAIRDLAEALYLSVLGGTAVEIQMLILTGNEEEENHG